MWKKVLSKFTTQSVQKQQQQVKLLAKLVRGYSCGYNSQQNAQYLPSPTTLCWLQLATITDEIWLQQTLIKSHDKLSQGFLASTSISSTPFSTGQTQVVCH